MKAGVIIPGLRRANQMNDNTILKTSAEQFNRPDLLVENHFCTLCRQQKNSMIPLEDHIGGSGTVTVYMCPECLEKTRKVSQRANEALQMALTGAR